MDADTIENVYMRLGASTKEKDERSIGGFGRARILTCFSQKAYQIASRDVLVSGSGAEYRLVRTDGHIDGCMLMIDIPGKDAYFLQKKLLEFLSTASLKLKLKLDPPSDGDGHDMPHPKKEPPKAFRRGRKIFNYKDEQGSWAEVWVNKSPNCRQNTLLVRVNGIAMHEDWLAEPVQVCVDLNPERARAILTASRDGLRGEYRRAIMSYAQEMAADIVSATRSKETTRDLTYQAGGGISVTREAKPVSTVETAAQIDTADAAETEPSTGFRPASRHEHGNDAVQSDTEQRDGIPLLSHDFHLCVDDATKRQRRNLRQLEPETWMETGKDGRLQGKSARYLLAAWTETVRHLAGILISIEPSLPDSLRIVPGFIVSEYTKGRCTPVDEGSWRILINPLRPDGKLRFGLSDPADRKRMIAIAMHEVADMAVDYHNEFYAERLTTLTGEVRDAELDRVMRAAMADLKERSAALEAELEAGTVNLPQSDKDKPESGEKPDDNSPFMAA